MLETRPYQPWSALDYSTTEQNLGVIFEAFDRAGIKGAWLPAAAHLMLETGNFKHFTAAWNYGNIKYFGNPRGAAFLVNYNDDDPSDLFLGFDDPQTGIAAYVGLLKGKYGIDGSESAAAFAQKLKSKGYATDPNFVQKVIDRHRQLTNERPGLLTWAGSTASQSSGAGLLAFFGIGLFLMAVSKSRI